MTSSTDSGTLHAHGFEHYYREDGRNHVECWIVSLILSKQLQELAKKKWPDRPWKFQAKKLAARHGVSLGTIYGWRKRGFLKN